MAPFLIPAGGALLMDGAMATQLQIAGAQAGECFELWNLTHPECVRSIHQRYAEAGAQTLLTNTFQANPVQLARHGLLEQGQWICQAAIELARSVQSAAQGRVRWVLGDVGPTAEQPGGVSFPRPEPLWQMAAWLSGVDALLLETCSDWSAWQAVRWLQESSDVPILLSLTFLADAGGQIRTWDGHTPEDFARLAADYRLAGLGVNCGSSQDMARIVEVVRRFAQTTDVPLFARPNAGTPVPADGRWKYPAGPEAMAARLPELLAAGVRMIGGCCGTTPEHIAAFRDALRNLLGPSDDPS